MITMDRQDRIDLTFYASFLAGFVVQIILFKDVLTYCWWSWIFLVTLPVFIKNGNRIRYLSVFLSYTIFSVVASFFYCIGFMMRPRDSRNMKYFTYTEIFLSKLFGIEYEVHNIEKLRDLNKAVILVNHQSIIDVFSISRIWDAVGDGAITAKKCFLYFWPVGLSAWLAGTIFVEKNKGPEAREDFMEQARKHLFKNQNKASLIIFPEGTRSKGNTDLLPFRKGGFWAGIKLKVPIVPVVISHYDFIGKQQHFNRGKIVITILDPVETSDLRSENVNDLCQSVWDSMNKVYIAYQSQNEALEGN